MYWLDIVIAITLAIGGLIGYRTGLIRTILAGVGVVSGIFLAGQLGSQLGDSLDFISDPNLARVAGFVIVFIATFMVAMILSSILRKLLKLIFLSWIDGVAGTIVGIGATVLVWTALIVATAAYPFSGIDTSIKNSRLSTIFADNIPIVLAVLPEEYEDILSFGTQVIEPTVSVSDFHLETDTQEGMGIRFVASITNDNRFGGTIEQLEYEIYVKSPDGMDLIGTGQKERIRIKSNATTEIELRIDSKNLTESATAKLLLLASKQETASIQIQGNISMSFLGEPMKFAFSKQFKMTLEDDAETN